MPVVRLTDGALFETVEEAGKASFIHPTAISHALRVGRMAGGHYWARVGAPTDPLPASGEKPAVAPTKRRKQRRPPISFRRMSILLSEIDMLSTWVEKGAITHEEALERIRGRLKDWKD